ncbi:Copper-transporting ATPase 2 [Geodia barretti]|uniref:P-type Cu(+) transporter n=1 Tax=Geodia barretti TaxID=519541 RepID=A0AA35QXB5_GEOBA|nr:Copper-transporting ATPase 2 [Geodia barretti]
MRTNHVCMHVLIGDRLWMTSNGIDIDQELERKITSYEQRGQTVVLTSIAGILVGAVVIHDKVKPEARQAIKCLQSMNVKVALLTGDNRRTALAIAQEVGIPEGNICAEVLPSHKKDNVTFFQKGNIKVAMVGRQRLVSETAEEREMCLSQRRVRLASGTTKERETHLSQRRARERAWRAA